MEDLELGENQDEKQQKTDENISDVSKIDTVSRKKSRKTLPWHLLLSIIGGITAILSLIGLGLVIPRYDRALERSSKEIENIENDLESRSRRFREFIRLTEREEDQFSNMFLLQDFPKSIERDREINQINDIIMNYRRLIYDCLSSLAGIPSDATLGSGLSVIDKNGATIYNWQLDDATPSPSVFKNVMNSLMSNLKNGATPSILDYNSIRDNSFRIIPEILKQELKNRESLNQKKGELNSLKRKRDRWYFRFIWIQIVSLSFLTLSNIWGKIGKT